jgi:hypothetical protein
MKALPASLHGLRMACATYINTTVRFQRWFPHLSGVIGNLHTGQSSDADYADIHAYIMTTGWIDTITIDGVLYNREALKMMQQQLFMLIL